MKLIGSQTPGLLVSERTGCVDRLESEGDGRKAGGRGGEEARAN
jgi:hypothetical protein